MCTVDPVSKKIHEEKKLNNVARLSAFYNVFNLIYFFYKTGFS